MSGNSEKLIAFNYFGGKFSWVEWLYRSSKKVEECIWMNYVPVEKSDLFNLPPP